MGSKKQHKKYIIHRKSWWKFWEIDELEFILPTRYQDAYEEVERKTFSGHSYSMELMDWVKDDIRQQLKSLIVTNPDPVTKAKKLSVQFRSKQDGYNYVDKMQFYALGDIYFDCDRVVKRENLLKKLGI